MKTMNYVLERRTYSSSSVIFLNFLFIFKKTTLLTVPYFYYASFLGKYISVSCPSLVGWLVGFSTQVHREWGAGGRCSCLWCAKLCNMVAPGCQTARSAWLRVTSVLKRAKQLHPLGCRGEQGRTMTCLSECWRSFPFFHWTPVFYPSCTDIFSYCY